MDKLKINWKRPTTRRLAQLYSALLYNAHLKGFITGEIYTGKAKYACVPGFNCYSCPGATGACPLGSLQNAMASLGHKAGWYIWGILLLFGITLGRTICGWFCPLGLMQELLHKIPTPKIKKSNFTRILSYLKYVFLAVMVLAIPMWYGFKHDMPYPAFCKFICPAGTEEGAIGLLSNQKNIGLFAMLGEFFTRKFVILMLIIMASVFIYRSFCRFICPLGAIYGLFNRFSIVGVKVDTSKCNNCGACVRTCKMDVKHVCDHECISCGQCINVCPKKAISFKAGGFTVIAPKGGIPGEVPEAAAKRIKFRRTLWGVALAVLVGALVWFNFLDPAGKKDAAAQTQTQTTTAEAQDSKSADAKDAAADSAASGSTAAIGKEVGNQLPDFTIKTTDGKDFHLADTRGKVVFINCWATYCVPCVHELPFFCELYEKHKDDIEILAVHSPDVTDDPVEYLKDKGWNIPFAVDTDRTVWEAVGAGTTLPQTIVLDRSGNIIYNQVGSVTLDSLEALYEKADQGGAAASADAAASDAGSAAAGTNDAAKTETAVASDAAAGTNDAAKTETAAASDAAAGTDDAAKTETAAASDAAKSDTAAASSAPIGNEVGNQLADFTIKTTDDKDFHLADTRGKIVFINCWATYCVPCVHELPFFCDLYDKYKDDIEIIAVHSPDVTDDPKEYLSDKGWNIPFAVDTDRKVWETVGAGTTLPQTIVLNRKGEVVYNQVGSVTPETLEALYKKANEG